MAEEMRLASSMKAGKIVTGLSLQAVLWFLSLLVLAKVEQFGLKEF